MNEDLRALHVVATRTSGSIAAEQRLVPLRNLCDRHGRACRIEIVADPASLQEAAARAVAAARKDGGVVVASGGDGSIALIARLAVPAGVAFGIVPGGTFNLLARDNAIPETPEAAARLLFHGQERAVRVGSINGTLFFVNASLGLYPRVLQDRERYKQRFGRRRAVAILAGLATIVSGLRTLRLTLAFDGDEPFACDAPTLFVGNNRLQLERVGVEPAPGPDRLVAFTTPPIERMAALVLALRASLGRLGDSPTLQRTAFDSLVVDRRSRRSRFRERAARRLVERVALDGEMHRLPPPWHIGVSAQPLRLIVPADTGTGT